MDFVVRDRSVNQGSRPLLRARAAYFALVDQGISSKQACRIVGITVRTGRRWRNGRPANGPRPAIPPLVRPLPPGVRGRFLSQDERIHIADRRRDRAGIRQIAVELGRDPATISRELRRNGDPGSGSYGPYAAQRRADVRRPRPKTRKLDADPVLRRLVQDRLDQWWTPQQIARRLRRDFPDRPEFWVSHLDTVAIQLNGRPRKTLDWDTPAERLAKLLPTTN